MGPEELGNMNALTGLTNDPYFVQGIPVPDGSVLSMAFRWRPSQMAWYVDFSYYTDTITFVRNGVMLTASPNILRQWRNVLPFGLAVCSIYGQDGSGGIDPVTKNSFVDGTITLAVLTPEEVQLVEQAYFTKINP